MNLYVSVSALIPDRVGIQWMIDSSLRTAFNHRPPIFLCITRRVRSSCRCSSSWSSGCADKSTSPVSSGPPRRASGGLHPLEQIVFGPVRPANNAPTLCFTVVNCEPCGNNTHYIGRQSFTLFKIIRRIHLIFNARLLGYPGLKAYSAHFFAEGVNLMGHGCMFALKRLH